MHKKLVSLLPLGLQVFLRNMRLLFTLDLHQERWRLFMTDKTIRGISQYIQNRDPEFNGLVSIPTPHSEINRHEFKIFSQNGEDGILLWLISKVKAPSKTFVEFGIGSGRECNTANLVLNFGWRGLMMDGGEGNVKNARMFFKYLMPYSAYVALDIRREFVTCENINALIMSSDAAKNADILSIDIDGNDYWVWEAITCITPRIVIMEFNSTFGSTRSLSTPYKPDFDAYEEERLGLYHGVSLVALIKLGKQKGYIFVGCDSFGANAFFVKSEFAGGLTEVSARDAFYENQHKIKRGMVEQQFDLIKDKEFVEIQ